MRLEHRLERLTADDDPVYKLMLSEQSQRFEDNVWLEPIREFVRGRYTVTVEEIFKDALYVPTERWTPKAKASISECLRALGWDNPTKWCKVSKRHKRSWINPEYEVNDEDDIEIEF